MAKAGFVGNDVSQAVFRSVVETPTHQGAMVDMAQSKRGVSSVQYAIERSVLLSGTPMNPKEKQQNDTK